MARESYQRRVERLMRQGYSRSQARGHPGKGEVTVETTRRRIIGGPSPYPVSKRGDNIILDVSGRDAAVKHRALHFAGERGEMVRVLYMDSAGDHHSSGWYHADTATLDYLESLLDGEGVGDSSSPGAVVTIAGVIAIAYV